MCRFITSLCAVALLSLAASAQAPAGHSYELRTYYAASGRLNELHARFRQHSLPLFQRHGAEVVGTWVPKPNPDNAVVVLLAYPSAAAREQVWTRLVADPEWTAMKRRTDSRGLLVQSINELPLAAAGAIRLPASAGDLELRTHSTEADVTGAFAAWRPVKPQGKMALLTLHPREVSEVRTAGRALVSAVVAVQALDSDRVTVLSPTDYSPRK